MYSIEWIGIITNHTVDRVAPFKKHLMSYEMSGMVKSQRNCFISRYYHLHLNFLPSPS